MQWLISEVDAGVLRAILNAYRAAVQVAAPSLHPTMSANWHKWATANRDTLFTELQSYLREASNPECQVRIFFKLGPEFIYGGCNDQFARDGGFNSRAEFVGIDDFDTRVAWLAQSGKYRSDDRTVVSSGEPLLGVIERQYSAAGTIWLDTSKVPIVLNGEAIGLFGTYEVIDAKTAGERGMARKRP